MVPPTEVDLLIVGSGPIGSTFAREVLDAVPSASVLVVDRGPSLTPVPGANLKNYLPDGAFADSGAGVAEDELIPRVPPEALARAGTVLLQPHEPRPGHMPAAAVSTNVGGMGAHWSCATPPPAAEERSPFIAEQEYEHLLDRAAHLLNASTRAFGASARGAAMAGVLSASFGSLLERPVQPMPHACDSRGARLYWTGTDTVLGTLLTDPPPGFTLSANTACTRVLLDGPRVVGAELRDVATAETTTVSARAVVVAADSLRTPQLLWASGVRPTALGRHLNEHSMVGATIVLSDDVMQRAARRDPRRAADEFAADERAAIWVPYSRRHRFSGQIENSPGSPAGFAVPGLDGVDPARIVSLTWFCPKQPRPEDRITFGPGRGEDGLPLPTIDYDLTADDVRVVNEAIEFVTRAGTALGAFVPGQEPALLADGQSLHYMGTVRMGAIDDGTTVCDPYSRVWGIDGLYVGGNGVIAPATACNPTLTSVALAVRAARRLAGELQPSVDGRARPDQASARVGP